MDFNKKKFYHALVMFFSIALLIGLGVYVYNHSSSFERIKSIAPTLVLILIGVHGINYFLLGMTHNAPLRKHTVFLKFKEWYGLCIISDLFNMLLPARGGTAVRLLYVNQKKKIQKRELISMGLAMSLPGFALLGIIGFIYCQFYHDNQNMIFAVLKIIFASITTLCVLFIFSSELAIKIFKINQKYSPKKYLQDNKLMAISLLCYLGMILLYPIKIYLSFKAIGIHIAVVDSFEISLILLAASFFQILPGNIGVKEMTTAYIAQEYGIQFETALLASLIDRAILMLFLFPAGAYYYWDLLIDANLPKISWQRTGASSRIPLMKRLVKVR